MADADIQMLITDMAARARTASRRLAAMTSDQKSRALLAAAAAIREASDAIVAANAEDMVAAQASGLSGALLDRLRLDASRVEATAAGVEAVARLDDPVGKVIERVDRPNGLVLTRVRIPIGVIGIIYESRPNVTADAGALCAMSGNAAILRGGSEAIRSNRAIHAALAKGLEKGGMSPPIACPWPDNSSPALASSPPPASARAASRWPLCPTPARSPLPPDASSMPGFSAAIAA